MTQNKLDQLCSLLLKQVNGCVVASGAFIADMLREDYTPATYPLQMIEQALFRLVQQKKICLFSVVPAHKAAHWMHDLYAPVGTCIRGAEPSVAEPRESTASDRSVGAATTLAGELLLIHRKAGTDRVIQISRDTMTRLKQLAYARTITPSLRRAINKQLGEHGRDLVLHRDYDGCYYLGTQHMVRSLRPNSAVHRV